MRYISTRSEKKDATYSFSEVVLKGLADDGGLFVPTSILELKNMKISNVLREFAVDLCAKYVGKDPYITRADLHECLVPALKVFENQMNDWQPILPDLWVLELFHGPTLAFKDVAMQFLGCLFEKLMVNSGGTMTILAATSGDTGSAAIEAFKNRKGVRAFILFPKDRVSQFQQRQMTTSGADNVFPIAIEGTFDDCQSLVKQCFNVLEFKKSQNLTAVNSINWARIMAQMIYFAWATKKLGKINCTVPTGNFGNVLAGFYVNDIGMNIQHLHIATNENDVLARLWNEGDMSLKPVVKTSSPSMDIQVPSNLERFIYEVDFESGKRIKEYIATGTMTFDSEAVQYFNSFMTAQSVKDAEALATARMVYEKTGKIYEAHSAIAIHAALEWQKTSKFENKKMVALATASAVKFPDFVKPFIGDTELPLPEHLKDIYQRTEQYQTMPISADMLMEYIKQMG